MIITVTNRKRKSVIKLTVWCNAQLFKSWMDTRWHWSRYMVGDSYTNTGRHWFSMYDIRGKQNNNDFWLTLKKELESLATTVWNKTLIYIWIQKNWMICSLIIDSQIFQLLMSANLDFFFFFLSKTHLLLIRHALEGKVLSTKFP